MTEEDRTQGRPEDRDPQDPEEELERVRRELEESRRRRKEATEAFDAFLRSFGPRSGRQPRSVDQRAGDPRAFDTRPNDVRPFDSHVSEPWPPEPTGTTALNPPAQGGPAPGPPRTSSGAPAARIDPTPIPPRPPEPWISEPTTPTMVAGDEPAHDGELESLVLDSPPIPEPPAIEPRATEPVARVTRRQLRIRPPQAVAAVVIIGALTAVLMWRMGAPTSDGSPDVVQSTAVPAPESTPAQPTAVPTGSPASTGFSVELTTLRPVWLRVIVDSERTIEREIPADQRIPLTAQETIVIRAGDAGALHVAVDGKDQGPLGQDGFPATKRFTRPR